MTVPVMSWVSLCLSRTGPGRSHARCALSKGGLAHLPTDWVQDSLRCQFPGTSCRVALGPWRRSWAWGRKVEALNVPEVGPFQCLAAPLQSNQSELRASGLGQPT